jgi:Ca2+:H+ antiporter
MTNTIDPLPKSASTIFFRHYWDIIGGLLFAAIAIILHGQHEIYLSTFFAAVAIAFLSVTVAEVAEILAERLEEPYGSFVLTFSAVAVEIILLFAILVQASNSTDALETVKGGIISAVIVDMNVLLGLAVFIGGLSFKEQEHNQDTSSSYTTILLVAASALLVPSILKHTTDNHDKLFQASVTISVVLFLFYIVIYVFQTRTHQHFFKATARSRFFRLKRHKDEQGGEVVEELDDGYIFDRLPTLLNFFIIFVLIAAIGFTAEVFAKDGLEIFQEYGISSGIAGLVIAIISVSPEIFTAIRAAKNDQMQRVVNIAMGASTVSIMLTVPVLMLLAYTNGIELTLDFNTLQVGALILTIILAWKTTDDGETNYFEGTSHLMFFACYAIIAAFY